MNISSLVIQVQPDKMLQTINDIKKLNLCEIHFNDNSNIIATIEAESASDEIKRIRTIEAIPSVVSVKLSYSYCEEELGEEQLKLKLAQDVPEWLNDQHIQAEQINYKGDLRKKI